jgi:hypothetical protein
MDARDGHDLVPRDKLADLLQMVFSGKWVDIAVRWA